MTEELNLILLNYVNSLISYIDQLRKIYKINEPHDIRIKSILILHKNHYQIIITISPSIYLKRHLETYFSEKSLNFLFGERDSLLITKITVSVNDEIIIKIELGFKSDVPVSEIVCNSIGNITTIDQILFGYQACGIISKRIATNLIRVASSHIFINPYQSITELIVNSIDAYRSKMHTQTSIGKFGFGFFSILYWVFNYNARIIIKSTYQDKQSFTAMLYLNKTLSLYYNDQKGLLYNGTSITIELPTDKFEISKINYELHRLDDINDVQITFRYSSIELNKIVYNQILDNEVLVLISPNHDQIMIEDRATGISKETFFTSMLTPSVSSKGIQKQKIFIPLPSQQPSRQPRIANYIKNDQPRKFVITVGDVSVVEIPNTFLVNSIRYVLSLPITTRLPLSRDNIIVDDTNEFEIKKLLLDLSYQVINTERDITHYFELLDNYRLLPTTTNRMSNLISEIIELIYQDARLFFVPSDPSKLLKENVFQMLNLPKLVVVSPRYDIIKLDQVLNEIIKTKYDNIFDNKIVVPIQGLTEIQNAGLPKWIFIPADLLPYPDRIAGAFYKDMLTLKSSNNKSDLTILNNLYSIFNSLENHADLKIVVDGYHGTSYTSLTSKYLFSYLLGQVKNNQLKNNYLESYQYLYSILSNIKLIYPYGNKPKVYIHYITSFGQRTTSTLLIKDKRQYIKTIRLYDDMNEINSVVKMNPNIEALYMRKIKYNIAYESLPHFDQYMDRNLNLSIWKLTKIHLRKAEIIIDYFSPIILIQQLDILKKIYKPNLSRLSISLLEVCKDAYELYLMMVVIIQYAITENSLINQEITLDKLQSMRKIIYQHYNMQQLIDFTDGNKTNLNGNFFYSSFISPMINAFKLILSYVPFPQKSLSIELSPIGKEIYASNLIEIIFTHPLNTDLFKLIDTKSNAPRSFIDSKTQILEIAINEGTTKDYVEAVLTELTQNSVDAIRSNLPNDGLINIELTQNYLVFSDNVGIESENLIYLLIPFLSSKESDQFVGQMGTGLFNIYRQPECHKVIIKTVPPETMDLYIIEVLPILNQEKTRVIDLRYKIDKGFNPFEKGTQIYIEFNTLNKEMAQDLLVKFNYFIENVLSYIDIPIYFNEHKLIAEKEHFYKSFEGSIQSHFFETFMEKYVQSVTNLNGYTIPTTQISQLFVRGLPIGPLNISIKTDRHLDLALKTITCGYLIDVLSSKYRPVQSRTEIEFSPEINKEINDSIYLMTLHYILKNESIADLFIDHFNSMGDYGQLKLYPAENKLQSYIYHDTDILTIINGIILSVLAIHDQYQLKGQTEELKQEQIKSGGLIISTNTPYQLRNEYSKDVTTIINSALKDKHPLIQKVVGKWLFKKHPPLLRPPEERMKITKEIKSSNNFLKSCVDIFWQMGSEYERSQRVIGTHFLKRSSPTVEYQKLIGRVGEYIPANNLIKIDSDLIVEPNDIKLLIQSKDPATTIKTIQSINKLISVYPGSTLLHELTHAWEDRYNHTKHAEKVLTIDGVQNSYQFEEASSVLFSKMIIDGYFDRLKRNQVS